LELRQLTYFCSVARLGHVTKAAERLHVAQSAVSRQIRLLEEELGAPLFVREGKGIRLAPFGARFLPHAERILRQVEVAAEEARRFQDPEAGVVRLGFPHSVGVHFVPTLLAAFRNQRPAVSFDLVQARVRDLIAQLRAGDLDVAIVTPWHSLQEGSVCGRFLFEESLVAVLPAHHPLTRRMDSADGAGAGETGIRLTDLAQEPFILFKEGYTLRELVWEACVAAGFAPRIAFEAEETDTIRAFVRAGLGVSILPPSAPGVVDVNTLGEGVVEMPLVQRPLRRAIGIAWWEEAALSAAAREFARFTVEFARERNP
jgi:LysR family transcriptional activator of glutamate synthase operon